MALLTPLPSRTAFNRCNHAPWAIASLDFQQNPHALEIDGIAQTERRLFARLARIGTAEERAQVFHDYVVVKFQLDPHSGDPQAARSSYLTFLRGWGFDSNGFSGAVLKSWVESRFGLPATFHCGRLPDDEEAVARYARDRMQGLARSFGIFMQLDLLYSFCQYELRRLLVGRQHLTLYRGTHDPDEYRIQPYQASQGQVVRLNNLSSFTADPEIAWEFGSSVWAVEVPWSKVVFFSGLLPRHLLEGECEYLVLGGDYVTRSLRY